MISFSREFFSFPLIISLLLQTSAARGEAQSEDRNHAMEYAGSIAAGTLGNAVTGILALSPQGDTLVSLNPNTLLMPASNMKLVTTGLALDRLGSESVYETRIGYSGTIRDSVLTGDLYIIGGGDPLLGSDDSMAEALPVLFGDWTESLKAAGIRKIDGHIIGDDRYFSLAMPEEQTWQWDDCGTYYGAGACGLTFFENRQDFRVEAGSEEGAPVRIDEVFPVCPWMEFRYRCSTGEAGTGDRLYFYTSDLAPVGEMRGTYAIDRSPKILECSNKFPALTCAYYFMEWLRENGTGCTGGAADTGLFAPEGGIADRDSLTVIGSTSSPTLEEIAFLTNHESNNVLAETVFLSIGKAVCGAGDYGTSRTAVRNLLQDMGVYHDDVVIRDGSGLSRHNLLSASFICSFLKAMEESAAFDDFIGSLPSPGSHGTMETVMTDYTDGLKDRIRLKSGSMSGVKCFSGYIFPDTSPDGTPAGKPAVFSILINNSTLSQYRMQKIIDRLIYLISAGTECGTGQGHQAP